STFSLLYMRTSSPDRPAVQLSVRTPDWLFRTHLLNVLEKRLILDGIEYGLDGDEIIMLAARGFRRFISLLSGMALALVIALAVVSFAPRAFGYMPFAVLSGSMEPELPVGSMVFVHQVDPTNIAVGDSATFYRSDGAVVTHQVYEVDPVAQTISTQGIANKNADGIIMHDAEQTPFSRVIGVVSFCVPYLGFVNAYCTTMPGLFVVVAVLALLVAVSIVLDRMVPDEPAGNHARAHAKGRRS
ncbi:signal peptidase I, partial [Collinsella aerofaciens]|uniref:signal peptidase I n=4 Tax=Collinsella aerofaciens TaxID=74426 RepID=UPI00189D3767